MCDDQKDPKSQTQKPAGRKAPSAPRRAPAAGFGSLPKGGATAVAKEAHDLAVNARRDSLDAKKHVDELVSAGMTPELAAKLASMPEQLDGNIALTKRLHRGVSEANHRAAKLETRLGAIEKFLAGDELAEALKAGQTGGRKSFVQALRDHRVTDEHIRQTLTILEGDEVDLNDADMFAEMFTSYQSLYARVDTLDATVISLQNDVRSVNSERVPLWVWIVSAVLGVIAGLWWSSYDWGSATHVSTSKVDTSVGKATVENTTVLQSATNNWIVAVIAGLAVFVLILWLLSLLSDKRRDHEDRKEKHQTIRQRVDSHYETKRQEKAEARRNGERLLDNISEQEPEREAVS